ncbi:MFS transporter [Kitasatospora indigofera]|uniref:MFS transporter n=1 Tax=Kitasatospora indigofera TaxID=67307 RepID=UPI003699A5D2
MAPTVDLAAPPDRKPGLGREYRYLLSAYSIQTLGEGMLLATLPLLAGAITSDPKLISGVALAEGLPWLLLALPGGMIVDRYDRRRLMIVTQAAQAVLLVAVALLATFGLTRIWMLYLLAFGLGAGDVLFTGANRAVIPNVVPSAALETANGRNVTAETLGRQFIGPPLGAALFAFLLPLPFWANALTYLGSLLLISRIRGGGGRFRAGRGDAGPAAAQGLRGMLAEATGGLRLLARHPVLRAIVVLAAASNFCVTMAQSVLVLFATDVLHVGRSGYGVLVATMAIGGVVGALASRRIVERCGARAVAITVSTASAVSLLAIGLFGRQTVVVVGLFCVWSAGLSLWNVMAQSVSQRLVPDELRGRVSTGTRMVCFGAIPLGALAGGFVAAEHGLRAPWVVGGLLNLVVALLFVPTMLRWPSAGGDGPADRAVPVGGAVPPSGAVPAGGPVPAGAAASVPSTQESV